MAGILWFRGRQRILDSNGDPVSGGKVNFYLEGTVTRTDTYSDVDLTTAHANPVVADSAGFLDPIYLDPEISYKTVITDGDDVALPDGTVDPAQVSLIQSSTFTAVVAGAGTPGTYETSLQQSRYYRVGDLVHVTVDITLASSITAGGTGDFHVTGLPFSKAADYFPVGSVFLIGVDYTATANLVCSFVTSAGEETTLKILETNDNASFSDVQVSGLAANDRIVMSITYITGAA